MGKNKESLVTFLLQEWKSNVKVYATRLLKRHLFVTNGSSCALLSSVDGATSIEVQAVPELDCTHEEADTRLLLHAAHAAANGYSNVALRSPDTDVAVLAYSIRYDIDAHLYFKTGTKARTRIISIDQLTACHGKTVCRAHPSLHALIGCDSTSAFIGRGKKSALALMTLEENVAARRAMVELGLYLQVSDELLALYASALFVSYTNTRITDPSMI